MERLADYKDEKVKRLKPLFEERMNITALLKDICRPKLREEILPCIRAMPFWY
jgi:hypothetical protein